MSNEINPKETRRIGDISNYYGCLSVAEHEGKFYWSIENWDGHWWEEIPLSLYATLVEYEEKRNG